MQFEKPLDEDDDDDEEDEDVQFIPNLEKISPNNGGMKSYYAGGTH